MNIDLKIELPSAALDTITASDLSALGEGLDLPDRDERSTVACQFIRAAAALPACMQRSRGRSRRVYIVISSSLVESGADGPKASDLATRLLEHSWNERIIVGLIGVSAGSDAQLPGLDGVIEQRALDRRTLRAVVQKVARRLWFKLRPNRRARADRDPGGFEVRQIASKDQFQQSLRLRHEVYSALGYIDQRIADADLALEFDGYDPSAAHYVVTRRDEPERIAGTMRVIVPGRRALPGLGGRRIANYAAWCEAFANEEESRVFRDLLNRRSMNSLPILDSFDYFANAGEQCVLREMIFPDRSCEVSRIVVHPDFRGCGILNLLMKKAIAVAAGMGKRYLLLECAPFHEHMYGKYGFRVVEDAQSNRHYARAQRLDSWAVAMHLELDGRARADEPRQTRAFNQLEERRVSA